MRKSKKIVVNGRDINVQELTPRHIDALMSMKYESQVAPSLGVLMDSELTADAVALATDIPASELLDAFTIEELADIWQAAEEVNDFLLQRLAKAMEKTLAKATEKVFGG